MRCFAASRYWSEIIGHDRAWKDYEYLQQKAAEGVKEVTVPELRPQFTSKYSMAYENDIKEDKEYWINGGYAGYFGFEWVYGVPRDEWTEY